MQKHSTCDQFILIINCFFLNFKHNTCIWLQLDNLLCMLVNWFAFRTADRSSSAIDLTCWYWYIIGRNNKVIKYDILCSFYSFIEVSGTRVYSIEDMILISIHLVSLCRYQPHSTSQWLFYQKLILLIFLK